MRLISAVRQPIQAKVPGLKPVVNGPVETVFPPRTVTVPFGQIAVLSETDGAAVMRRYGEGGVVQLPDDVGDSAFQEYFQRAKEIRYKHLRQQIGRYKVEQAARQARGDAVSIPGEHLRRQLREAKMLQSEINMENEVLNSELPPIGGEAKLTPDPIAEELADYGVSPQSSPIVPGVTVNVLDPELGF